MTVRVAHAQAKLKAPGVAPINSLTSTLTSVGFGQLADDISIAEGKRMAFTSVGLLADWNNIVVQAEYGMRRAKTRDDYLVAGRNRVLAVPAPAPDPTEPTPGTGEGTGAGTGEGAEAETGGSTGTAPTPAPSTPASA
mgnify:CR=1 FL=1